MDKGVQPKERTATVDVQGLDREKDYVVQMYEIPSVCPLQTKLFLDV